MHWTRYTPILVILGLILSSLSLILNISKYKETTKSRDGMLAELKELKNMTSQYLEVLEWTASDLRNQVKQLEKYNKKLLQKIVNLKKDEKFPALKPGPIKTIRIQQRNSQYFNWPLSPLELRIPADDANLVLFNSPKPQLEPITSTIGFSIIRKDQIPWQKKFRIDPVVIEIPFIDWALVFSYGPRKIRFCADAFLLLASVLPAPISPFDIVVDKQRKVEIHSSGITANYVEIGIRASNGPGLPRSSVIFLDAIIKLYPHIERAYRSKNEIFSDLSLYRKLQRIGRNKKEQKPGDSALDASLKIELETYKKAIQKLRTEAGWYENIPSLESLAHVGVAHHYKCAVHVRLQRIDRRGYAILTVEE